MVRLAKQATRAAGKALVGRTLNWLTRGQITWAAAVEQATSRAEVISFDIFDTALLRPLARPDHLFWFLEGTARELDFGEQFRARRISAEREARVHAKTRGHEEVTLAEIYGILAENARAWETLAEAEFALELELTKPHPFIKSLYDDAIRSGKRVVFTSDTYLSREQVKKLLERNGYLRYEELFVSSDSRLSKRNGSLFRLLRQRLAVEAGRILHIGDTFRPDVLRARMAGLRAGFFPRPVDAYTLARRVWGGSPVLDVGHSVVLGLAANHFVTQGSRSRATPYEIGYEVVGPLYVAKQLQQSELERFRSRLDPAELDRGARAFVADVSPFFERDKGFSTPFEPAQRFLRALR